MRKILKEYECISCIESTILFEDIKNNKEKFNELMMKLNNDFLLLELYNGDKLVKYAKEKDIYKGDDYILFKHSKGTALIKTYSYGAKKQETYIYPLISTSTTNFISGWTFDTGMFSDVYTMESSYGYLSFSSRDTLYIHNIYIYWIVEQLEKTFKNFKGVEDDFIPLSRNIKELLNYIEPIHKEFDEFINRNKSKRIDSLIVDNLKIKDYIKKKLENNYFGIELEIFKCCMLYGKPYYQVEKYIDKIKEKYIK